MATIKSFTSLEQSCKLTEILPVESADMVHFGIHQGMDGKYHLSGTNTEDDIIPIYKNLCTKVFVKATASDVINQLPCWSLTALLNVMPKEIIYKENIVFLEFHIWENSLEYANGGGYTLCATESYDNPIDACVNMIEKLHELKML